MSTVWLQEVLTDEVLGVEVSLEIAEGSSDLHITLRTTRELAPDGTIVTSPERIGPGRWSWMIHLVEFATQIRASAWELQRQAALLAVLRSRPQRAMAAATTLAGMGIPNHLIATGTETLKRLRAKGLIRHNKLTKTWEIAPGDVEAR